jgi:hypothetical protein
MTESPKYVADFDSATAMTRANASFLHGEAFANLGQGRLLGALAARANLLPWSLRRLVYIYSGAAEAIPTRKIDTVSSEEIAEWVTDSHPAREYPAVAIGSSNGALTHLWSAMGIPWLPQTVLIPVRQRVHPDEPIEAMEKGLAPGRRLLERNPDLQLHHMHDANQDRLMVRGMTYFRVKRRRLGPAYERFLAERLPEGGTIYLVDCGLQWDTTRIDDRFVFQHGAPGGATEEEFHEGSERIEEYLERYGSHRRRWPEPPTDGRTPEAEWGFEPAIEDDIARVAERRGYRVVRVRFEQPDDPSPFVADLFRTWYQERGIPSNRLLVSSFVVMDPWWTLRTGSVPYWLKFNTEPSADAIERYLDGADPYDEIHLMLFSHGVDAVGVVPKQRWQAILDRAKVSGRFAGVDPDEFPGDFAVFARYDRGIRAIRARYPMPGPLPMERLERFVEERGDGYEVSWTPDLVPVPA